MPVIHIAYRYTPTGDWYFTPGVCQLAAAVDIAQRYRESGKYADVKRVSGPEAVRMIKQQARQ